MSPGVDTFILGAAGYVGGELIRLVTQHPGLELRGALSRSSAGTEISEVFPHLGLLARDRRMSGYDELPDLLEGDGPLVILSALPHGESAARIASTLELARSRSRSARVVDLAADFRLGSADRFQTVYERPHGAPELCADFRCALPDLAAETPDRHVAHPGCFTTAVTLAAAPLVSSGLVEPRLVAVAVTGSTGSGSRPVAGTHHPDRHGNLKAYSPLAHRHVPEMESLLVPLAAEPPEIVFAPHSGPFARGIHVTMSARLAEGHEGAGEDLQGHLRDYYAQRPFVEIAENMPSLRHVVGSNRARLGMVVKDREVLLTAVIDNLVKGAAGGAVHWVNRMLEFEETTGLEASGPGWD